MNLPRLSLAGALARALDPVKLCQTIGMEPDPWQAELLRSNADRILVNCHRQSGKSLVAALLAIHIALHESAALVLIMSPSERQSRELFAKVLVIYRAAGRPVSADAENKLSLELENGSRIVCLPGKASTIRGFSAVRLLIIDEAAQVEDELYSAVRPMLAVSNGRLIAMSTPWGKRGWWYFAWTSRERWLRFEVPATECPRISAEFLEEERRTHGEWDYRQEYLCQFEDSARSVFRGDDIDRIIREEVEAWTL